MIIEETGKTVAIIDEPKASTVAVPRELQRAAMLDAARGATGSINAVARVDDLFESLESAERIIADLVKSFVARRDANLARGESILNTTIATFQGHASRLAESALDAIDKFVRKAIDTRNMALSMADNALELTPARPVRTPEETAWVLAVTPEEAAYGMWLDKQQGLPVVGDTTASAASVELTQQDEQTIRADIDRRVNAVVDNAVQFAQLQSSQPQYTDPNKSGPCFTIAGTSTPIDVFNRMMEIKNNGGWMEFVPSDRYQLEHEYIVHYGDYYSNFDQQFVITFSPYGQIWGTADVGMFPTPEQSRELFPSIPSGHYWTSGNPGAICPSPASPPPPPIVPPPPPPPFVPDQECCPPPPRDTEEVKATKPIGSGPNDPESYADWCKYINDTMSFSPADPSIPGGSWLAELKESTSTTPLRYLWDIFKWDEKPVAGGTQEGIYTTFALNQLATKSAVESIRFSNEAQTVEMANAAVKLSAGSWAETITGAPINYLYTPYKYKLQYIYPTQLPEQTGIDSMYLYGSIGDDEWECMTRSLGNLSKPARAIRDAGQARVNIGDCVELFYRGIIQVDEFQDMMRTRGVTDPNQIDYWMRLREQQPQMPDLVRFMVRDVENEEVVKAGNLFDGFNQNYKGRVKQWAEQQAIPQEYFQYVWAAHWELPSPTAANEMLRRLRPGRVDPSLSVTEKDIKSLYAAADYAPGWRDKLLAISYNPVTRTDIKQGYIYGSYDRPEIIELLQDTGLDKKGAETVAKLYDTEKERASRVFNERNTIWTVKTALKAYVNSELAEDECRDILRILGMEEKRMDAAILSADLMRTTLYRRKCMKGVYRQFFVGRLDEAAAQKQLVAVGVADDLVASVTSQWACERASGLQEVPARKNTDWAIRGVITIDEFVRRMTNLRYAANDIAVYVEEILGRIREAAAKAADAALRRAISDARARLAEYRKQIADREKKIKELEKKQKDLEKGQSGGKE